MRKRLAMFAFCLAVASPLFAQKKEDDRLSNAATVMQEILGENNGLPKSILAQAECVLIFPSVKKVAIGIGGSYGRGALVCRTGAKMNGDWGAPAMYKLDQGSIGVQLGSTATDFVLVVMNQKGSGSNPEWEDEAGWKRRCGCRTHGRSGYWLQCRCNEDGCSDLLAVKGIVCWRFARRCFDGKPMTMPGVLPYGKQMAAKEIVSGGQTVVPAAKTLVDVLDKTSPSRK